MAERPIEALQPIKHRRVIYAPGVRFTCDGQVADALVAGGDAREVEPPGPPPGGTQAPPMKREAPAGAGAPVSGDSPSAPVAGQPAVQQDSTPHAKGPAGAADGEARSASAAPVAAHRAGKGKKPSKGTAGKAGK